MWWITAADALRSLYLRLVKKYHPDLALSQVDKQQRHEMMIAINKAWEGEDSATLQAIDATGKVPPPPSRSQPWPGARPSPEWERTPGSGAPRRPRPRSQSNYGEGMAEGKAKDLRLWAKYLRGVATEMASFGYTEADINTSAGGPAVDGEVNGYFFSPGKEFGAYIQAGSSRSRPSPIMARWTAREVRGKHTQTGPNQWFPTIPHPRMMAIRLNAIAERQNREKASEY
jgi:hypothetical protein